MKYVLDTSAIISSLVKDVTELSEFENSTVDTLISTDSQDILVPSFVLFETEVTLTRAINRKYKFSLETQILLLERFKFFYKISETYLPTLIEEQEIKDVFMHVDNKELITKGLSLTDIGIIVIAINHGVQILSCDRKLLETFEILQNH